MNPPATRFHSVPKGMYMKRKEGLRMNYVTYSDLFQFVVALAAVATLAWYIGTKNNRPMPKVAVIF